MAETMGFKKNSYTLKEEGIKTPIEWGKGKYITSRVIEESILRSRAVLGERNHCGVIFKDTYPPIISPEQFDLVQAAIAKRRLNPTIASPKLRLLIYSKALVSAPIAAVVWL
ncbi:recombinase family protein [Prochlorococcus marinus]